MKPSLKTLPLKFEVFRARKHGIRILDEKTKRSKEYRFKENRFNKKFIKFKFIGKL